MDGLSIKISHKAEATTRGPGGVLQKAALKNFAVFTGKHLCWNLFLKRDSNIGVFL